MSDPDEPVCTVCGLHALRLVRDRCGSCYARLRREGFAPTAIVCANCGQTFTVTKRTDRRYCSRTCAARRQPWRPPQALVPNKYR
jgi:hypothetical protein